MNKKSSLTTLTASTLRSILTTGGDTSYEEITLPIEHEGEAVRVYLRPLSAGAVVEFLSDSSAKFAQDGTVAVTDIRQQSDAMLRLVARQVCDSEGNLIFSLDDMESLRQLPVTVFNVLRDRALGLITAGSETGKDPSAVATEPIAVSPTA